MKPKTLLFACLSLLAIFDNAWSISKEWNKKPDKCSDAVHITKEITHPVLVSKVNPVFPEKSLSKRRRGTPIIAEAVISRTGTVDCAKILRSEHEDLNASVLEAIAKWKYKPAMKGNKPISVYFTVVVHIDLR